jgi:hypothetical protein
VLQFIHAHGDEGHKNRRIARNGRDAFLALIGQIYWDEKEKDEEKKQGKIMPKERHTETLKDWRYGPRAV